MARPQGRMKLNKEYYLKLLAVYDTGRYTIEEIAASMNKQRVTVRRHILHAMKLVGRTDEIQQSDEMINVLDALLKSDKDHVVTERNKQLQKEHIVDGYLTPQQVFTEKCLIAFPMEPDERIIYLEGEGITHKQYMHFVETNPNLIADAIAESELLKHLLEGEDDDDQ